MASSNDPEMAGAPAISSSQYESHSEKRDVALSSVIAAIGLTTMKLVVGILSGSLGILSEALHSGLDLVAALVTFFAVRASDKPADERHQYGHGKIENLSALIETVLLLITCIWIIYEAIARLFFRPVEVEPSIWAFLVMGISIVIDVTRSRALMRVAKAHNSQALEADALHFSTDVWSSAVVIAGLICVLASRQFGIPWLAKADAIAALIVALIVVWVSIQLGRRAISVLLDTAPQGVAVQVERAAREVAGVSDIGLVRVRQAGAQTFVDITINVSEQFSLEHGHAIAARVEDGICATVPGADVIVHVDTLKPPDQDLPAQVRAAALANDLQMHGLSIHDVAGRLALHVHVEVQEDLTLDAAHQQVTAFEGDLRKTLGRNAEIVSHIEPACTAMAAAPAHRSVSEERLRLTILETTASLCGAGAVHDIHILAGANGQRDLSMHCDLAGETSIQEAHRISDRAEAALRKRLPELGRITIHVEPAHPVTQPPA
jgi:cation diffusion facilitator family transporter